MFLKDGRKNDIEPVIGITTGDPAGIGPEISLKAVKDSSLAKLCTPLLIGDLRFLASVNDELGLGVNLFQFGSPAGSEIDGVAVIDVPNLSDRPSPGIESAATGRAAAEYIEESVRLWRQGTINAVATAPISKNALHLAGYDYPGHTEFYAKLTGTDRFAMSFFAEKLRVVLLSTHVSLREAIGAVAPSALVSLIRFSALEIEKLIGRAPKIAVAGVNPHASEGGLFGSEEAESITPAIEQCRADGIDVSGPYSPDTVFLRGFKGEFDLVVACYHDQATIAVKSLSFGSSVNVTLGLPIIRTSVDHGTAFEIAGRGVAEESSMKAAVRLAAALVQSSGNAA